MTPWRFLISVPFYKKESPTLVFLSDTKLASVEMAAIKHRIRVFEGVYSDSRGRAEGLALLWKKEVKVSLISHSFNHIDVEVEELGVKRR